MDVDRVAGYLTDWIRARVSEANAKGCVFGLSGGLDSAVVAGLCARAFPSETLAVIMPCHSLDEDVKDARLVAQCFGIHAELVDLAQTYDSLIQVVCPYDQPDHRSLVFANIKPRLRMATLYYYAALKGYLVVGTTNKTELTVGYFTKHGDGGVDIQPLGDLAKCQVVQLAEFLAVPERVVEKVPSGGLWEGQTDESEIGLSYEELDKFVLTGSGSDHVRHRIESLRKRAEHKRKTPPIAYIEWLIEVAE